MEQAEYIQSPGFDQVIKPRGHGTERGKKKVRRSSKMVSFM